MSLHDTGIKRSKIKSCDGFLIVATLGLNDSRTFVLVTAVALVWEIRNDELMLKGFTEQLADEANLLSSGKKVVERHTRDTSHFRVVDQAHELVKQSLW